MGLSRVIQFLILATSFFNWESFWGQFTGARQRAPYRVIKGSEVFVQALSNLKTYANFGIVLFIVWSLISWLVGMNFSLEGKQY